MAVFGWAANRRTRGVVPERSQPITKRGCKAPQHLPSAASRGYSLPPLRFGGAEPAGPRPVHDRPTAPRSGGLCQRRALRDPQPRRAGRRGHDLRAGLQRGCGLRAGPALAAHRSGRAPGTDRTGDRHPSGPGELDGGSSPESRGLPDRTGGQDALLTGQRRLRVRHPADLRAPLPRRLRARWHRAPRGGRRLPPVVDRPGRERLAGPACGPPRPDAVRAPLFPYDDALHPTSWVAREALDVLDRRDPRGRCCWWCRSPIPTSPTTRPSPTPRCTTPPTRGCPTKDSRSTTACPTTSATT